MATNGRQATQPRGGPITRTTITERVYEDIKERILDQTLAPGERLTVESLSRDLQTSSSPIREALARLESEKLVVQRVHAGFSVAPPPDREFLDGLIDFRLLLEPYCAEIGAPKKRPDTLDALEAAFAQMSQMKRVGTRYREYKQFVLADAQFHQAIVDSAGNPATSQIYSSLHAVLRLSRLFVSHPDAEAQRARQNIDEHKAILLAYRAGDAGAARAAVRKHLEGSRSRLLPKTA